MLTALKVFVRIADRSITCLESLPFQHRLLSMAPRSSDKKPLPLHKHRHHHRQRARAQRQEINLTHRLDNHMQYHLLHLRAQALNTMRPYSRNRRLDRLPGQVRCDRCNAVRGFVQEHGIGDAQRDSRAGELGKGAEADGDGNQMLLDLGLDDGEGELDESAAADAEDDAVAVDLGRGGAFVDGVEEGAADDGEHAAEQVPGHVVGFLAHDDAVGHGRRHVEDDVGEKTDARLQGDVVAHELEVQRDEVDRGEDDGGGTGCGEEGHDHDWGSEELHGEESFRCGGEEGLLNEEYDDQDACSDEKSNDTTAVPWV